MCQAPRCLWLRARSDPSAARAVLERRIHRSTRGLSWPAVDPRLAELLDEARASEAPTVFLTGAGISAESGIPTFRGPEGYWQVGSRNYQPEELATHAAFEQIPDEIWSWYLYRRAVCVAAEPNAAHHALVALERAVGDRMLIATQNVDGLHLRAGSSLARTYQIHGNIDFMRCADECGAPIGRVPEALAPWPKERRVGDAERKLLVCERCGGRARPHVLWFDETYDEERYRFESSLEAASRAALLVIVGTSGATNLPNMMARLAARSGAAIVALNADPSPFTALAESLPRGHFARGSATDHLPAIAAHLARGPG